MKRIEELEKELTKVCSTYENDCSQCPKQAECEEYCKLEQEEEEPRSGYKVGYRIDEDAAHGIKQCYRIIATFDYLINAEDFIKNCIPAENQDRFFMLSNNTRYYPATGEYEIF